MLAELQSKVIAEHTATVQQLNAIQANNEIIDNNDDSLPAADKQIEVNLLKKCKKIKLLLRNWKVEA